MVESTHTGQERKELLGKFDRYLAFLRYRRVWKHLEEKGNLSLLTGFSATKTRLNNLSLTTRNKVLDCILDSQEWRELKDEFKRINTLTRPEWKISPAVQAIGHTMELIKTKINEVEKGEAEANQAFLKTPVFT